MKAAEAMEHWMAILPTEWQQWLAGNLARGCDTQELIQIMRTHGFSLPQSHADRSTAAASSTQNHSGFSLQHLRKAGSNAFICQDQTIHLMMHMDDPAVFYFADVLSEEECDQLIALSERGGLSRSTVVDIGDGSHQVDHRRISDSTSFQRGAHPLIAKIEQRIADLVRWPVVNGEGLQVLRYQKDGEYRPHVDYFAPELSGSQKHLVVGGQRVASFVLYLSDVEAGGGTRFPRLGLECRPKRGAGVLFSNVDANGKPHPQSLHAGMPVISGTKYIATKWLREQPYKLG